jgi:drug/metabolite transporter (DMT)-like permease
MASFFLREGMEHLQILGGAVVVGVILLLQVQREQDEIAPELIRTQRS